MEEVINAEVIDNGERTGNTEIEIVYDTPVRGGLVETNDPFLVKVDDVRDYRGVSPALKKRASRALQKFGTGDEAASKLEMDSPASGYRLLDVQQPPLNPDYLAALYEISSPHKAAVDAKVANIVGLGYDWVESPKTMEILQRIDGVDKTERARRKLEREKNAMDEWLDGLNKTETFDETMRKVWTDYEVTGNGYIEIGRKVNGEIGYIGHAPSQIIRIRTQRDGFVQMVGRTLKFFRNFGDLQTPNPVGSDRRPNEIIHIKKYTPTNTYYGMPDILAARNALAGNEFASRYNLDYFEHKAVPRYVIVLKGAKLSETSESKLIEFFTTGLKGQNHRTLYIPLPDGTKEAPVEFEMKAVEAGEQESSFGDYRRENTIEIFMAHRTPMTKAGVMGDAGLAAARDADKTFKEQVCRPEQKIFDKKMALVVSERTDALVFKLNELTLTDEDTQSKIDERYLRMQTIVPNEVRRRMGLPGLPGGDSPVDLKPQQAAETRTEATGNRQRDQQREGGPDVSGEGRNEQGAGRQTG